MTSTKDLLRIADLAPAEIEHLLILDALMRGTLCGREVTLFLDTFW